MIQRGVHEFVFGTTKLGLEEQVAFWRVLGFEPVDEGQLDSAAAQSLYGHGEALYAVRLAHVGCESFDTGYVRLHAWERLRNPGLGSVPPIVTGSRWMGMYTSDILQLRDSLEAEAARGRWDLWLSPLVFAPLAHPAPTLSFEQPFVGLRETLAFGRDFRLAFIQRGGFERPGFGTINNAVVYRNSEGSHANIVQSANAFDSDFYKQVFGWESAPYGERHTSGEDPATRAALDLRDGELFDVERTRAPGIPSGLLQIYASQVISEDYRDQSRAGSGNLCLYSVACDDVSALRKRVTSHGGEVMAMTEDEFSEPALYFAARDGYHWIAREHAPG